MICPECRAETSDMSSHCEWCGAVLARPAASPSQAGPPAAPQGGLPGPSPSEWYPHQGAPAWQAGPPGPPPPAGEPNPWYLRPWPYVAAIVLVIVVVGLVVVLAHGSNARPDMVVAGKPTLLDFYTDT